MCVYTLQIMMDSANTEVIDSFHLKSWLYSGFGYAETENWHRCFCMFMQLLQKLCFLMRTMTLIQFRLSNF